MRRLRLPSVAYGKPIKGVHTDFSTLDTDGEMNITMCTADEEKDTWINAVQAAALVDHLTKEFSLGATPPANPLVLYLD